MWVICGILAILFAILNLYCMSKNKETKYFRFLSMAFTALTLCFNYAVDASWVVEENWGALIDTTPYMATYMFWCTIVSIVLNGITLVKK